MVWGVVYVYWWIIWFFSCTQSKSLLHGQLSASWMRACLNTKDQRAEPALPNFSKKYSSLSLLSINDMASNEDGVYGHKMQAGLASQPCCHKEFILLEPGQLA